MYIPKQTKSFRRVNLTWRTHVSVTQEGAEPHPLRRQQRVLGVSQLERPRQEVVDQAGGRDTDDGVDAGRNARRRKPSAEIRFVFSEHFFKTIIIESLNIIYLHNDACFLKIGFKIEN
jgi:hypothetical protein